MKEKAHLPYYWTKPFSRISIEGLGSNVCKLHSLKITRLIPEPRSRLAPPPPHPNSRKKHCAIILLKISSKVKGPRGGKLAGSGPQLLFHSMQFVKTTLILQAPPWLLLRCMTGISMQLHWLFHAPICLSQAASCPLLQIHCLADKWGWEPQAFTSHRKWLSFPTSLSPGGSLRIQISGLISMSASCRVHGTIS